MGVFNLGLGLCWVGVVSDAVHTFHGAPPACSLLGIHSRIRKLFIILPGTSCIPFIHSVATTSSYWHLFCCIYCAELLFKSYSTSFATP